MKMTKISCHTCRFCKEIIDGIAKCEYNYIHHAVESAVVDIDPNIFDDPNTTCAAYEHKMIQK